MKIVIADPKKGRAYQTEIDDTKSKLFHDKRISEEIDGNMLGLNGYKLKITGGTDKDGFPMRADVHGTERKRILISGGAGVRKKGKGERVKKTVRGNTVSDRIAQINVIVTTEGEKGIAETLGLTEKPEKEKKDEVATAEAGKAS
jgi:small subunit ribosomal protein S6e